MGEMTSYEILYRAVCTAKNNINTKYLSKDMSTIWQSSFHFIQCHIYKNIPLNQHINIKLPPQEESILEVCISYRVNLKNLRKQMCNKKKLIKMKSNSRNLALSKRTYPKDIFEDAYLFFLSSYMYKNSKNLDKNYTYGRI